MTAAGWKRTHSCGELRPEHVGREVTLNGWVDARRDHGGIYFLDLRDRYGVTQVTLEESLADSVALSPETVLSVRGQVRARDERNVNPDRATGAIELQATSVQVLSPARVPPFEIRDDLDTAVEIRLRHRYLDLRRPSMLGNLVHRARFVSAMRRAFDAEGFVEVETPVLTKATPEGARDYLVPSRVHAGKFYALPQSPQIFKQLLMCAGVDRYYQVARCFRDEDLRADRQPEFTQLDMEMSFVEEEDVFEAWERVLVATLRDALGYELPVPIPRLRYDEAIERFGLDKPDTRFGLELVRVDEWAASSDFKVFSGAVASGGHVVGLRVPGEHELSRKEVQALEAHVKEYGAKGLAWWKAAREGGAGPLARFVGDGAGDLMERLGAADGDLLLFVADRASVAFRAMGELRNLLGRKLGLIPEGQWNFLWVTHFPMFDHDEESGTWSPSHHPFTAPEDPDLGGDDPDLGSLRSRAYDLVLNGWELGSGSVRIHDPAIQQRVFRLLGISEEEQRAKFGFLLEGLSFGAPPHAGFALGLDRVTALTRGLDSIRDMIAFPKTTSAADLMCEAPSEVPGDLLAEVHVRSIAPADPA